MSQDFYDYIVVLMSHCKSPYPFVFWELINCPECVKKPVEQTKNLEIYLYINLLERFFKGDLQDVSQYHRPKELKSLSICRILEQMPSLPLPYDNAPANWMNEFMIVFFLFLAYWYAFCMCTKLLKDK